MDNKDILNMELSEEEAQNLATVIQEWKEETLAKLEKENDAKFQAKIDELEEANNEWREEVAEEYSSRFLEALDEMREDVKAQVLAESVEADPVHKVMEQITRLVAPMLDESYMENTYASEIKTLSEKLAEYERKEALAEGAKALEELIEGYDDSFKPALRALIGEGTEEEVTRKFEAVLESLAAASDDEDVDDEDVDEDSDLDFDFDDEDEEVDEEFEEDKELSVINEDEEVSAPVVNKARASMMRLI